MRYPQLEDGFFLYAHELDAAIATVGFGRYESVILREIRAAIFGPAKMKTVLVSPSDIAKRSGLSRSALSESLHKLVAMNVLIQDEDGREVRLNKAYELWRDPRGKPLFTAKMVEYIALAAASAMSWKHGYMPPKMAQSAIKGIEAGVTITVSGEPMIDATSSLQDKVSENHDGKCRESATDSSSSVVKARQEVSENHDGKCRESATAPYRGTGAMDTVGDREDRGNPPTPLNSEPIKTASEGDLPPGSDVVIAEAGKLWEMTNPTLAQFVTRKLLREFKNAALVLHAIGQAKKHADDGETRLVEPYAIAICKKNTEAFKDAEPPKAKEPEKPPQYTYASQGTLDRHARTMAKYHERKAKEKAELEEMRARAEQRRMAS